MLTVGPFRKSSWTSSGASNPATIAATGRSSTSCTWVWGAGSAAPMRRVVRRYGESGSLSSYSPARSASTTSRITVVTESATYPTGPMTLRPYSRS